MVRWLLLASLLIVLLLVQWQQQPPWPMWGSALLLGSAWHFSAAWRLMWACAATGALLAGEPSLQLFVGVGVMLAIKEAVLVCIVPIIIGLSVLVVPRPLPSDTVRAAPFILTSVVVDFFAFARLPSLTFLSSQVGVSFFTTATLALLIYFLLPPHGVVTLSRRSHQDFVGE